MDCEKLYALIGLAVKAGKCSLGSFAVMENLKRKKVRLLIVDGAAKNTVDKLRNNAGETPFLLLHDNRLQSAVGRDGMKVAAVLDEGFANAMLRLYIMDAVAKNEKS